MVPTFHYAKRGVLQKTKNFTGRKSQKKHHGSSQALQRRTQAARCQLLPMCKFLKAPDSYYSNKYNMSKKLNSAAVVFNFIKNDYIVLSCFVINNNNALFYFSEIYTTVKKCYVFLKNNISTFIQQCCITVN